MRLILVALLAALFGNSAYAVDIDWVTVGDPGNACDPQPAIGTTPGGCFGAVPYSYRIGKHEVTNAQYAEFLNAKAADDPLQLYNPGMKGPSGGITRSGGFGSFTYSVDAGRGDKPVHRVSFYDALRFANWLHNGQGSGDTETGAYTLLGGTENPTNGTTIARNPGATIVLTSEDEWYKAAYYDAVATSYNAYPFADGFDGVACEAPSGTTTHSANCQFSADANTSDVGAYTGSPSAYGTFDQGGNVAEWNEAIVDAPLRGVRGGTWEALVVPTVLGALPRGAGIPDGAGIGVGFRVAMVPEPTTGLLLMTGVLGMASWRRRDGHSTRR